MMIEKIKTLKLVFDGDFFLEIKSLLGRNVSFQSNGDVSIQSDTSVYEVFNLRRAPSEFKFFRVGEYKDKLHLNFSNIRDYDSTGKELLWPNLTKAQCSPGKVCVECILPNIPDHFAYIPGDLYVVGTVPVYENAEPLGCGKIRDRNGYQIVQSMVYAVKKINDNIAVFPKQKIGLIILNSCNNRFVITRKINDLYQNGLRMVMGYSLNMTDTSLESIGYLDLKNRILGFVGGLSSILSIPMSEILQQLKYVQISYASTNPSLSDRNLHPYFMRTVTPDNKQADVIIKILLEFKSDYIQIVYSEGSYGVGGRDTIREAAKMNKICIAQEIIVRELPDGNYYDIIEQLRNLMQKFVIIFIGLNLPLVMKALGAKSGEFMFIGSEAWGHTQSILQDNAKDFLESSLTLSLEMVQDEDVISYVQGIDPTTNRHNAWMNAYIESKLGCYYPWSYDKSKNRPCTERDKPNQTDFEMDISSIFAYNSVLALLMGADQFFKSTCGPSAKSVCPDYAANPEQLIKTLKSVKLNITKDAQMKLDTVFDDNGDGTIGYTIYYIQKDPENLGRLRYTKVGEYQPGIHFWLHRTGLGFPLVPSSCPNQVACNDCGFNTDSTPSKAPVNSEGITTIAGLGVAVAVVLIVVIILVIILIRKRRENKDNFQKQLRHGQNQRSLPKASESIYHTIPGQHDCIRTVNTAYLNDDTASGATENRSTQQEYRGNHDDFHYDDCGN
ncbi:hypothetical protein CHS0354_006544 [Potamilus streckersoni]|uniref:Receptor ligand binding region domain-containing protein n=1 Tax=Potamilus streckersoni TaxID=2493646 RepID=A0AAE0WBD2_9BIVA|nr:hypothetical protein CHS0354_006544 [Potamilus streckersoni]